MPLYEYRCKSCGHQFEKIQSFSAPEEKECPQCHAEVERLLSAPAIQFKGSGWYVTDYANKSSAGKASGKSDDKSGGEVKAEGKSETKSETKSESKTESKPAPAKTSS